MELKEYAKLNFLQGKKTYIVAVALILFAVTGIYTGQLTVKEAVELLGLGAIGATIRKAL
jgi:hypothetical protein